MALALWAWKGLVMRKRFTRFAVVAMVLATVAQAASAGEYVYDIGNIQASYVVVRVLDSKTLKTGTATAFLVKYQGFNGRGPAHVLPAPAEHKTPGLEFDYFGCVDVKIAGKHDGGCDLKTPVTVDFDPLMTEGRVQFSIKSSAVAGYKIDVNLLLKGLGTGPGPAPACKKGTAPQICDSLTPAVDPGPHTIGATGTSVPAWANGLSLSALRMTMRDMTVVGGSVRGDFVGGGPVQSSSVAQVFNGAGATLSYESDCIVKLGTCRT